MAQQKDAATAGRQPGPNGIVPTSEDILCGKDKSCVHAPGSVRFRSIIESYRQRYASSLTKFDKMQITKEIYETLSQTSRFLKYNSKDKTWEEISPMAARDKCGHALRFANRHKGAKKKPTAMQDRTGSETSSTSAVSAPPSSLASSNTTGTPSPVAVAAAAAVALPQRQHFQPQGRAPPPPPPPQQNLWGELLKRYDTMWSAAQIRVPPGNPANSGTIALSNAAALTGSPAMVRTTNPEGPAMLPLVVSFPNNNHNHDARSANNNNHAVAPASVATAPASFREGLGGLLNGASSTVAAAVAAVGSNTASAVQQPQQRRKPTLEDLCFILKDPSIQGMFGSGGV